MLDSLNDVLTLTTTNNGAPVDATYTTTSTDVTINGNSVQYTTRVDTRQTIPVNTIINDKIVADTFITLEAVPVTGFGEIALSNGVRINVRDSTDFNLLCNRNDSDTYITINGISFRKDTLTGFIFGPDFNLDTIGPNFLYRCSSFNQSLTIPPSVVNIGSCFLANCYAFNKPLTIPSTVVSIDSYFLAYCKFNQPLTIPATITSIDYGFLYECHDFDSYIYCPGNASKPTGWANYASSFQGTHLIYK
ncbi:hypothetical protein FACS1894218_0630 [Bacilli bacterium]|nr:hypothetical protein FACS1894218_0630 [Bacilli bacterium]